MAAYHRRHRWNIVQIWLNFNQLSASATSESVICAVIADTVVEAIDSFNRFTIRGSEGNARATSGVELPIISKKGAGNQAKAWIVLIALAGIRTKGLRWSPKAEATALRDHFKFACDG